MILRQFNQLGIVAFKSFLAGCRDDPTSPAPRHLLEMDSMTEKVTPQITVELQRFELRKSAADYLTSILAPLPTDDVAQSAGLWTWLSLLYFDEVCPIRSGKRIVRNDYSYVFEPKNVRHFYRHLLFIAWNAARLAKKHDRLYMNVPLASLDKMTEAVMKRLYLTRIPCIFEVLDKLYWDEERQKARKGVVDANRVRPGDLVHRFPIRIQQLERTFDLFTLKADQLIRLLGEEFTRLESVAETG